MKHTHAAPNPSQDTPFMWIASEISINPVKRDDEKASVRFTPLLPIRRWLDGLAVEDRKMAQTLASVIPAQCPFERTISIFGRKILQIPPLCKLNPFYDELVGLRFRALCYLADVCGEDISPYC